MKISSKDFGVYEITKEDIICFPEGLFAFEDVKEFVLIEKDNYLQKWLQSVGNENPRFIVFEPNDILEGYMPLIPEEMFNKVGAKNDTELTLYVIAVIPDDIQEMTVNLKSPVIINHQSRLGAQIILDSGNYPVRHRVFAKEGRGPAKC